MSNSRGRDFQPSLQLGGLVCEVCPYGVSGRCKGAAEATAESYMMQDSSVVGCLNADRQSSHYTDFYGWRYPKPQKSRQSRLSLPTFIPQVATGLKQELQYKARTLFAVSLSSILRENGVIKYKSPTALRRALKLPPNARLALIGAVADRTLEFFWQKSEKRQVWSNLASLEFEFATSLTFSVWLKQPRYDQIYNQDRNLATHDYLSMNKIPSIPFLFFYNEKDYQENIKWLKARRDVSRVAMLAQFYETNLTFEKLLGDMHAILQDVGRELLFVVVGASTSGKIRRVLRDFENATIITNQPFMKAIYGQQTRSDLSHFKAAESINNAILAANNIAQFETFCLKVRTSKRIKSKADSIGNQLPLYS